MDPCFHRGFSLICQVTSINPASSSGLKPYVILRLDRRTQYPLAFRFKTMAEVTGSPDQSLPPAKGGGAGVTGGCGGDGGEVSDDQA